jgi:hypothetical protein
MVVGGRVGEEKKVWRLDLGASVEPSGFGN